MFMQSITSMYYTVGMEFATNPVLLAITGESTLSAEGFTGPILSIVNLALRIIVGILIGVTGIKLLMSSLAMSTAVGDERQQRKDDLMKCLKNFGITVAIAAAVIMGGSTITDWLLKFIG